MDDSLPERYVNRNYLDNTGGSWHADDGPWKASQLEVALEHERTILERLRHSSSPIRLVDMGCGSGAALNEAALILQRRGLVADAFGVDPSPDALEVARRLFPALRVMHGTLADAPPADLLLLFDVIEHVARPDEFLRKAMMRARFLALHIPLEENVYARLRGVQEEQRIQVGHLHFYHRWSALRLLRNCGLKVLWSEYTSMAAERRNPSTTRRGRVMDELRHRLFFLSKDVSAHTLGGCSLMVLCEGSLA